MRKLICALATLCLLFTLFAVAEAADIAGTWYLNDIIIEGSSYSPAAYGMQMVLTFDEDGTGSAAMTQGGTSSAFDFTWTIEGDTVTVTTDGSDETLIYADDQLTEEAANGQMVFGREDLSGAPYAPAAPVEAAIGDFAGSWTATYAGTGSLDELFLPWDALVDYLGEPVTIAFDGTTGVMNWAVLGVVDLEVEFDYADGMLVTELPATETSPASTTTVQLLEDGNLLLTISAETDSLVILTRAE